MLTLIPILAEAAPDVDPHYFKDWITVAGWVLGIAATIWGWTRKPDTERTITNDPINVRAHEEFVPRREFSEYKEHMSRVHGEIKEDIRERFEGLTEDRKESINNLHAHLDGIEKRIHERLAQGNQTMTDHGEDIAALKRDVEHLEKTRNKH